MKQIRAFSLMELLVVIAIILVIAAILFPVFSQAKARAKLTDCQSRLHQVAFEMQLYRGDNDYQVWIEYFDQAAGHAYTTAGGMHYPWNDWLPMAGYVKTGQIVWCPEPDRDEVMAYNLYSLRKLARPEPATSSLTTWLPLNDDPGRVVAFCDNHATTVLEKPDPAKASFMELWKGVYPAVREDGGLSIAKSSQIELWYLWQDGTWHPAEQGTETSSQLWKFPGEPWPPTIQGI